MAKGQRQTVTPKQERFIRHYLLSGNASEAYRKCYSAEKMTDKSVTEIASRLLKQVNITSRLAEVQREVHEAEGITVERIAEQFRRLGFYDVRRAYNKEGALLDIHAIDDETAAAIVAIESEAIYEGSGLQRKRVGTLTKVKFADKHKSLESLGRWKKMFVDQLEIKGDLEASILAARRRLTKAGSVEVPKTEEDPR